MFKMDSLLPTHLNPNSPKITKNTDTDFSFATGNNTPEQQPPKIHVIKSVNLHIEVEELNKSED